MAAEDGLERFVEAQAGVFERALEELKRGRKAGHWMWFVFPQIAGLGFSPMAQRYAIGSLDEARAYLAHPVLGPRLLACVSALNGLKGLTAREVMGQPDDLKLRSCLTLFEAAAPQEPAFGQALDQYYGGVRDRLTLERLGRG